MFYTAPELLALLVVAAGVFVQSRIGIGYGLLAAPILYQINPAYVPGPILIIGFSLAVVMVLQGLDALRWRRIFPAIVARVPGAWCGALLVQAMSQALLGLFLGATLLLATLLSWRAIKLRTSGRNLALGGFFSGLVGTATGIGGPPMALVYQAHNPAVARAELAGFFLIGTLISLGMLFGAGQLVEQHLLLSLKLLPGMALGSYLGYRSERFWQINTLKPWILAISLLAALLPITKGILALNGTI
ncbi:sulfite exporter TauE/SafE family protein [Marinobacterium maritimum]|uniref:Probable membrane transporter protein n=1 Tax=Marinobacterium maritimum TaxID=500162 RepID=A0ABN1I473_9GAMM